MVDISVCLLECPFGVHIVRTEFEQPWAHMMWVVPQALGFVEEPRVFDFNVTLSNVSFSFICLLVGSLVRFLNSNHMSLC